jgi:hypothetical protein
MLTEKLISSELRVAFISVNPENHFWLFQGCLLPEIIRLYYQNRENFARTMTMRPQSGNTDYCVMSRYVSLSYFLFM